MKAALDAISKKSMGWLLASKTFHVPQATLRRRFKKKMDCRKGDLGGRRPVFNSDIETQLVHHIKELETRFFGLTTKDLMALAYQLADRLNINHRFNRDIKMAGWKWIRGFLRRNPSISLRTPENTSLARAQAFNKENIGRYFESLTHVMEEYKFLPENIFNVDESGLSTVQSRPSKIFATKGRKQVGTLSSAERGHHLTVVCCMNPLGTFIPPAFIFPRKRFKNELMDHATPGAVAFCQDKGWMSGEVFLQWMKHFVRYAKPDGTNKILLLLDGHSSHKSLEVLEFAKSHGIVLFCFPAHCTHRVQPLDVGFFGPLQIYYDQEIQLWMKQNPGRSVTHFQVADIFSKAYLRAAVPTNAINSFYKTGIHPLNSNIFEDWLFAPSLTTETPISDMNAEASTSRHSQETEEQVSEEHHSQEEQITGANAGGSTSRHSQETVESVSEEHRSQEKSVTDANAESSTLGPSQVTEEPVSEERLSGYSKNQPNINQLCQELSPIPSAPRKLNQRKRKRGKVGVLNTTPEVEAIKMAHIEKEKKAREKLARKAKKNLKIVDEDEEAGTQAYSDADSDVACPYCNELYSMSRPREYWLKCQTCERWCHAECAGADPKVKQFQCDICTMD